MEERTLVELKIVVRKNGVEKTQIYAPAKEQVIGTQIYELVHPHITAIHAALQANLGVERAPVGASKTLPVSMHEFGGGVLSTRSKLTLKELADQFGLRLSWLYERSRHDELPGQMRFGNQIRVDVDLFEKGAKEGKLA